MHLLLLTTVCVFQVLQIAEVGSQDAVLPNNMVRVLEAKSQSTAQS